MAFPIGTDASEHGSAPITTYFLIIANVLVFLVEQSQGEAFVRHWAFIPRQFFADPIGHLPTVFTAMPPRPSRYLRPSVSQTQQPRPCDSAIGRRP